MAPTVASGNRRSQKLGRLMLTARTSASRPRIPVFQKRYRDQNFARAYAFEAIGDRSLLDAPCHA